MKTRNQEIAADVFRRVQEIERHPKKKQYGAMSHKLPVLIKTAGLAQALGFVDAKSKSDSGRILATLLEDLAGTIGTINNTSLTKTDLLNQSRNAELPDYLRLSRQSIAALLWYKRFAQSVLGIEQGESED
ncbi:MAG TPA: type III-B CRISPR module-associated protein Cmr5 [Pyrinomonadaceae bacterium]|jgi:CRISPR-associated protein Cmr5